MRETTAHWIETLNAAGAPCGRVTSLAETFADPRWGTRRWVLRSRIPGTAR